MSIHPNEALVESAAELPIISACDHYAGDIKRVVKSLGLQAELHGAFDITLDLEDGAAVGAERSLREEFLQIITGPQNRYHKLGMRVHDFDSPFWPEEITAIVQRAATVVSHITIPKTQSAAELAQMLEHLRLECERIGSARAIPVHVLIESPQALIEVNQIAALPWVRCLEFGLMDFVSSHSGVIPGNCMESPGQFDHPLIRRAKVEIAAAAVAHNKIAAHNVTTAYNNQEQTRQDALRARNEFGFLRMWSIHPSQIQPILTALSPSPHEITMAAKILLAAHAKDWAPISVEGKLHDRASYRYYWHQLQRAHANGVAIAAEALNTFFSNPKQGTTAA